MKFRLLAIFIMLSGTTSFSQPGFVYSIDSLETERMESERPYLSFLNNETMMGGIYVLKAGATDSQEPHQYDEIYYVMQGKAKIEIEDKTFPARKGDVIFVKALDVHRFVDIEEDIHLLVFFSKKKPE